MHISDADATFPPLKRVHDNQRCSRIVLFFLFQYSLSLHYCCLCVAIKNAKECLLYGSTIGLTMGRIVMLNVCMWNLDWSNDVACGINYAMVLLLLFIAIFVSYEYLIISFMLYNYLFEWMKIHIFDEWIEWTQFKLEISTLMRFFYGGNMKKEQTLIILPHLLSTDAIINWKHRALKPQTGLVTCSNRQDRNYKMLSYITTLSFDWSGNPLKASRQQT